MLRDDPWFVATDLARVLGYRDATHAIRNLDDDEKGLHTLETPGGDQELSIVSESGLYGLIFRSRKEVARKFRRWVTSEVLPSIRKYGAYGAAQQSLPAPSLIEARLHRHDLRVLEVARYIATHGPNPPWLSEVANMAGLSTENTKRALDLLHALNLIDLALKKAQRPW